MQTHRIAIATHDEVYQLEDPDGFLALHRSRSQPTFGGIRICEYPDAGSALRDALALAEAMTRKCAINSLPAGGAKTVLIASNLGDRRAAIAALGEFIESMDGRYIAGPDLGFTPDDLQVLRSNTRYAAHQDLSGSAALGVIQAIRGALEALDGSPALDGVHVAVQGLGAVGLTLARRLREAGARVSAADLDPARCAAAAALGAAIVPPGDLLELPCDVLAPAAAGGVIDAALLPALGCRVVCGAANNVLADEALAAALQARGITYVPDFLSSSGALVEGGWTHLKGPGDHSARVLAIRERTRVIVSKARVLSLPPLEVALDLIREWI